MKQMLNMRMDINIGIWTERDIERMGQRLNIQMEVNVGIWMENYIEKTAQQLNMPMEINLGIWNGEELTEEEFNNRNSSCEGKVVEVDGKKYKLTSV